MVVLNLGIVVICLRLVLANSTTPSNKADTSVEDIKSLFPDLINYPTFASTNYEDLENSYQYYRCGFKGIKAFRATPNFKSPKSRSLCRHIENIEFNNYKHKCGIGSWDLVQAPWLVSVMIRNFSGNNTLLYRATGTIIHPNIILVPHEPFEPFPKHKLMIRSNGETENLVIDNMNTQTREVVQTITENLKSSKYQHLKKDLLVLSEPIMFNEYAQSICLPQSDEQYERNHCYVLGWSRTNQLRKLLTHLIECNDFNYSYGRSVPQRFFVCTPRDIIEPFKQDANYCPDNQICDFSTVLVCPAVWLNNVFYQVGVGYMVANNKGYFLSTTASKLWIDKTVFNLQFKSQYYTRGNNESQAT